jgi:hypothetical protein
MKWEILDFNYFSLSQLVLNGNIALLCMELTAGFEYIQRRSGHVIVLCVAVLESYRGRIG